ncbi:MAG TPA: hypothetical protein VGM03_22630 [Phycisphaerae bacterium]|jgi:hypothetical protein
MTGEISRRTILATLVAGGCALVALAQEKPADPSTGSKSQDQPMSKSSSATKESAATQPARREPPAVRTPSQPSAEDVLREFQKERPTNRPVLPSGEPGEQRVRSEPGAPTGATRARLTEGYFLADRAGRLSREGQWWVFTFEAENPSLAPEPPLKLLPNRLLELMVRESESATNALTFIVSGEVTDFRGENYLLLRKLLRRRDMGNLSK